MKRRLKRIFKVLLILIAIVVIVAAFLSWRSLAAVETALESIRERGEPVSIADLKPEPVADGENAATYLAPIAQEIQQVVDEAYPVALAEDFSWRTGLTQDQTAQLRTILDAHSDLAGQLTEASHCEKLAWPLDYDRGPSDLMEQVLRAPQSVRSIARFQVCRARYLAAIDNPDAAVAVCLDELRLTRLQADTPLLVSWMMNMACRRQVVSELNGILQTKTLLPETHAAIEHELGQHDLVNHFIRTLQTERAFGIESFRGFPTLIASLMFQWENYIEYMNEQIDIGSRMPFEPSPGAGVTAVGMTELLVPAIDRARDRIHRTLATERCTRVLNAILARPDPESPVVLSDLKLPAETIIDPYSGRPFLTRSTDEGWIVYSVGENGIDDGGEVELGRDTDASLDIGVGPPPA